MKKRIFRFIPLLCALSAFFCTCAHAVEEVEEDSGSLSLSFGLGGINLLETFSSLFSDTIQNFLSNVVNEAFELVDSLMLNLLDTAFHAENLIYSGVTTLMTPGMLQDLYTFLYAFVCGIVVLKFMMKGFQIYILWRDGDAEVSPGGMLVGLAQASVAMLSFPFLYDKGVDIFMYLADGVMGRLGVSNSSLMSVDWLTSLSTVGFIFVLFSIIFFVLVFVLWIMLLRQGFELLILRLGFPFATLGLIDSDAALFKNYLQVFFKYAFTVIIQVSLMSLSFRVIATLQLVNLLAAIALMCTAMSTPRLLQQFLLPSGGGGGLAQKAYSTSMAVRAAKMLFM